MALVPYPFIIEVNREDVGVSRRSSLPSITDIWADDDVSLGGEAGAMSATEKELISPNAVEYPDAAHRLIRSGSPTFFGATQHLDLRQLGAQIAFLGVPFDQATNDRPGSRFAPLAIRDASMRMREGIKTGWIDLESGAHLLEGVTMADCGDVDIRTVGIEETFDAITAAVRGVRSRGALPVIVGGDHAITYPALRAYDDLRLAVIHFDAHMDFTDVWAGQRLSHDNPLRRVLELPQVAGLIQIGLRGFERPQVYQDALRFGVQRISAQEFIRLGAKEALKRCPAADAYYVTLDIDVLDPAVAPGTGYPEAGGLNYYQLKEGLIEAAGKGRIVGFDLVEVNPLFDQAGITSRLAARLILDFLGAAKLNGR
jgi:agmatinase